MIYKNGRLYIIRFRDEDPNDKIEELAKNDFWVGLDPSVRVGPKVYKNACTANFRNMDVRIDISHIIILPEYLLMDVLEW